MTSYGMFLTFAVLIESMQDENTAARRDGIYGFDYIFRICMHFATALLFALGIFVPIKCSVHLFPDIFTAAAIYVCVNGAYFGFLQYKYSVAKAEVERREKERKSDQETPGDDKKYEPVAFLFDPENLPPVSVNNLRYNLDLFDKQMWFGFYGGYAVTGLSISMITIGLVFCNQETLYNNTSSAFICINSNEWVPLNAFGNIYLMILSLMILFQINLSQYILIRLPYTSGIFDTKTKQNLKLKLLADVLKECKRLKEKEEKEALEAQ